MRTHPPKRAFFASRATQFATMLLVAAALAPTAVGLAASGRTEARARVLRPVVMSVPASEATLDDGTYYAAVRWEKPVNGRPVLQVEWTAN